MRKGSISQIKIGAIITYFSIAFNIIAGLIYTPWMIEQIGQSDYGIYTLANSLISLFLIDFGLSSATSRFVAKYRAEGDEKGLKSFISAVYKLYIFVDLLIFFIFVILFFCLEFLYRNLTIEELEKLKIVYCIAGLYSIIQFPCITFNGILTAYEEFVPLKFADLIQRIGSIILTVAALILGYGLYALVLANTIFGLVAIGIKYFYVRKNVKISIVKNESSIYKQIFSFSVWSTIWAIAQRLIFNITPTILGLTVAAASSAIAVFGVITTIEGYFHIITTAINGMFLSKITRIMQDDSDGKKISSLMIKVGRFQFALNSLIAVCFLIIGREFILLWMGEAYIEAYYGVLLVVFPGIFYNALQIAHTTMVAQNLMKYQAYIQIIIGLCNVVCSIILSYNFGLLGAAIAICISYIIRVMLTLLLIKKKLNIDLDRYIKECYGRMSIPFILTSCLSCVLLCHVNADSWVKLILKGAIVTIIYLIAILWLGLKKQERRQLFSRMHLH